jgi:hypothetical protein
MQRILEVEFLHELFRGNAVRIWDVPTAMLCRQHLLGEHRELHAVWTVLTQGKQGYARHPETIRWDGKLAALYARHETLVAEMTRRGYRHGSPLDRTLATGSPVQDVFVDPVAQQIELLTAKPCPCPVVEHTTGSKGGACVDRRGIHDARSS